MFRVINNNGKLEATDSPNGKFLQGEFTSEKEIELFVESLSEFELQRWVTGKPVFVHPRVKGREYKPTSLL